MRHLLCFLLIFTHQYVSAQSVTLKIAVDKRTILIGEPFKLTLEATVLKGRSFQFFALDTIPHFEFIEQGKIDTLQADKGMTVRQVFTLTSWDSGKWVLPRLAFTSGRQYFTDTLMMNVTFAEFDRNKDYNEIKDIIEVQGEQKGAIPWYYYALAGLVVLVIIYLLLRKKKKPIEVQQVILDPYLEAVKALELIKPGTVSDAKPFYTRLSGIFREYIFHRKKIMSLQKTTDDLVVQLRLLNINGEAYNDLAQALRMGDFVKFAKYVPGPEDHKQAWMAVRNAIESIEKQGTNAV